MSSVATIDHTDWTAMPDREAAVEATRALEAGDVVLLPELGFAVESGEASFFTPAILDNSKNASFDPASGRRRILRVFSNVNPEGRARGWRIGDEFETVARRFAPELRLPLPGTGHLLSLLRVTKTRRSPYDALMLQLHDRMKADEEFQTRSPQTAIDFPAGSTWIAFTDQVSHAATAGQYQLEQTFLVPVQTMLDEQRSPLRILERLKARRL